MHFRMSNVSHSEATALLTKQHQPIPWECCSSRMSNVRLAEVLAERGLGALLDLHQKLVPNVHDLVEKCQRMFYRAHPQEHIGQVVVASARVNVLRAGLEARVVHVQRKLLQRFLVAALRGVQLTKVAVKLRPEVVPAALRLIR